MAQGRSTKIISMIKWIRTSRLLTKNSLARAFEFVRYSHARRPAVERTRQMYCDPKGRRALLRVPSTEGRSVCLCWEHSKPKGPKGKSEPDSGPDFRVLALKALKVFPFRSKAVSTHEREDGPYECTSLIRNSPPP